MALPLLREQIDERRRVCARVAVESGWSSFRCTARARRLLFAFSDGGGAQEVLVEDCLPRRFDRVRFARDCVRRQCLGQDSVRGTRSSRHKRIVYFLRVCRGERSLYWGNCVDSENCFMKGVGGVSAVGFLAHEDEESSHDACALG